jgi:hypothetical protein
MKTKWRWLCVVVGIPLVLVACIRDPFSTRHVRYSLDLTVEGHHYLIQRDVECYDVVGFNLDLGIWMRETHFSGRQPSVVSVGNDLAVVVTPPADCLAKSAPVGTVQEHGDAIKVISHPADPLILYRMEGKSLNPPITVNREWSETTAHGDSSLAPTREEREAALRLTRLPAFTRVTVRSFPSSEWAASPGATEYFAQFDQVTPASSTQLPGHPDWVDVRATFPKWKPEHDQQESELGYDGHFFVMTTETDHVSRWRRVAGSPLIKYKDVVFAINQNRELYDPETRTIYSFTAWQAVAWQ